MALPEPSVCYCTRCRRPIPDDLSRLQGVCDDCLTNSPQPNARRQPISMRWLTACSILAASLAFACLLSVTVLQIRKQGRLEDALKASEKSQRTAHAQADRYRRELEKPSVYVTPVRTASTGIQAGPSTDSGVRPPDEPISSPEARGRDFISNTQPVQSPLRQNQDEIDWDGNLAWRKAAAVMVEDFIIKSRPRNSVPFPGPYQPPPPLPAWCEPGWSGMIRRPSGQFIFGARGPIGAKGAGLMDFTPPKSTPAPTRP